MEKYFEGIYSTILYDVDDLKSPFLFSKDKVDAAKLAEKNFFTLTEKDEEFRMTFKKNQEKINLLSFVLNKGENLLNQIKKERKTIRNIANIPDNYLWFKSNVIHEEIVFDKKNVF
uniref:Glycosyl transferase family 2 n=1 Tax=Strongyloides venezuelensis TaxID=75913 RepID=A0A0K0FYZ2_STRVS